MVKFKKKDQIQHPMYAIACSEPAKQHAMRLQDGPYEKIRAGEKTIELRLWDEKRQQLRIGDTIVFTPYSGAVGSITARIVALHKFASFEELYQNLPLERCGYAPEEVESASYRDMEQYYSPQEQQRYGVVGIEVQVMACDQ